MKPMETKRPYQRPPFEIALADWKSHLTQRGFSTDLLWILEENLCFAKDLGTPAGAKLAVQTQFTPQPPDAAKFTYHHFAEMDVRLGFYRVGANAGRSICLFLCA